jgi:hypothetical protein
VTCTSQTKGSAVRPREERQSVDNLSTQINCLARAEGGIAKSKADESRSRVFLDAQGDVRGFIGIWPRRMVLRGRTIEAAIAGSMMVDQPDAHPTAGARLLRAYLSGPQELSFSETANDISQRMCEKVGGERLPASSLDWLRVLRPAGFAVALAGMAFRLASVFSPVASGFDRLVEASGRNPLTAPPDTSGYRDAEVTNAELAELVPT